MERESKLDSAFELLGRRWAMPLVWELRRDSVAFADLRKRLGISPSVLSTRLGDLSDAGVVDRDGSRRYRLTGRGRELARLLYELNRWASRVEDRGVSSEP